jgi:N4-gp56 family major capsid protein
MPYDPAGNLTSSAGLAYLQDVYRQRTALDRLQKKFVFREACMEDQLPLQNGRTVQWFRWNNFGVQTTPSTEGTVPTSQSLSNNILAATVSQYSAFVSVSTLLDDTAPDPILQNAGDLLGYQGGFTVDTITRNVIDAESSSTNQALLNLYLRVADLRNSRSQLQANDVQPKENDEFLTIAHPFTTYDLVNDPAANGLADIVKYTNPQNSALVKYEDRGTVAHVAGCKVIESTNVFTQTTPNRYRVYVFGKDGVGAVSLSSRGPAKVMDPRNQRFNINVVRGGKPTIFDPTGEIGGAVSYRFVYTAVVLDGPVGIGGVYRFRTLDAQSTIA